MEDGKRKILLLCCVLSHFSCVRLFATPWTVACLSPLSIGFFRYEYWSGLPFPTPGDLPDPGTEPTSLMPPTLTGKFFTTRTSWEAIKKQSRPDGSRITYLNYENRGKKTCSQIIQYPPKSHLSKMKQRHYKKSKNCEFAVISKPTFIKYARGSFSGFL